MLINRVDVRAWCVCIVEAYLAIKRNETMKISHTHTQKPDGFGNHYVKWGGQFSERQSLMLPHMQISAFNCYVCASVCMWMGRGCRRETMGKEGIEDKVRSQNTCDMKEDCPCPRGGASMKSSTQYIYMLIHRSKRIATGYQEDGALALVESPRQY